MILPNRSPRLTCAALVPAGLLFLLGIPAAAAPPPGEESADGKPVPTLPRSVLVAAVAQPDLQIREIRTIGDPVRQDDGTTVVGLRLSIINRGTAGAGAAKIAVIATPLPSGIDMQVPYHAAGQADRVYAWTAALAAGAAQEIRGTVVLPPVLTGKRVRLVAEVDSIAGEELRDRRGRIIESNETNNRAIVAELAIPGAISALRDANLSRAVTGAVKSPLPGVRSDQPALTPAPASRPEGWAISLQRLHVWRPAESSGDDPQLWPIVFRARFGDPASVQSYFHPHAIRPGVDLDRNAIVPVRSMYRIRNARRIRSNEFDAGQFPEVFGIVALAFEDNGTPDGEIRRIVERAGELLRRELQGLVGRWDIVAGEAAMRRSMNRITESLTPSLGEVLRLVVESGADPDLPVGLGILTMIGIDPVDGPPFVLRAMQGTGTLFLEPLLMTWDERETASRQLLPMQFVSGRRWWRLELSVDRYSFHGAGEL